MQKRREWPVKVTQAIQNRMITPLLASDRPVTPPWPLRLLRHLPWLRRLPARLIGMGVRPEHVAPREADRGSALRAATGWSRS